MKIRDQLRPEAIELSAPAGNRDEIIERLISLHEKAGTFSGNGSRRNMTRGRTAQRPVLYDRCSSGRRRCSPGDTFQTDSHADGSGFLQQAVKRF